MCQGFMALPSAGMPALGQAKADMCLRGHKPRIFHRTVHLSSYPENHFGGPRNREGFFRAKFPGKSAAAL